MRPESPFIGFERLMQNNPYKNEKLWERYYIKLWSWFMEYQMYLDWAEVIGIVIYLP